jgi:hypothetical protein
MFSKGMEVLRSSGPSVNISHSTRSSTPDLTSLYHHILLRYLLLVCWCCFNADSAKYMRHLYSDFLKMFLNMFRIPCKYWLFFMTMSDSVKCPHVQIYVKIQVVTTPSFRCTILAVLVIS